MAFFGKAHLEELRYFAATSRIIRGGKGCSSRLLPKYSNFYGLLESFNPNAGIFFTHVGELRVTYHEMHYVLGLLYGEFPYEKHFPTSNELDQLRDQMPEAFKLYWEVSGHFNICMDLSDCWN